MARDEQDREDLLREATALVHRVELAIPDWPQHVVAGFRRDGCLSLFFGPDPAYHFNTLRQLRRAYVDGLLYKAEHGTLVALRRERTENEMQLIRQKLDRAETGEFIAALLARMTQLRRALDGGSLRIVGQSPLEVDIILRTKQWLSELGEEVQIAASPNVG